MNAKKWFFFMAILLWTGICGYVFGKHETDKWWQAHESSCGEADGSVPIGSQPYKLEPQPLQGPIGFEVYRDQYEKYTVITICEDNQSGWEGDKKPSKQIYCKDLKIAGKP